MFWEKYCSQIKQDTVILIQNGFCGRRGSNAPVWHQSEVKRFIFFISVSLSGNVSMLAWRETFKLSTIVVFLFCLLNIRISKCFLVTLITSTKIWANVNHCVLVRNMFLLLHIKQITLYIYFISVTFTLLHVTADIVGEYDFNSVFSQKLCIDAFVIILTVHVHSWQLLFLIVSGSINYYGINNMCITLLINVYYFALTFCV